KHCRPKGLANGCTPSWPRRDEGRPVFDSTTNSTEPNTEAPSSFDPRLRSVGDHGLSPSRGPTRWAQWDRIGYLRSDAAQGDSERGDRLGRIAGSGDGDAHGL